MPRLTCQHTDEHATEVDAHLGGGRGRGGEGRGGEGRGGEGREGREGEGRVMTRDAQHQIWHHIICRYVSTPNYTVRNIISNKPVSGERSSQDHCHNVRSTLAWTEKQVQTAYMDTNACMDTCMHACMHAHTHTHTHSPDVYMHKEEVLPPAILQCQTQHTSEQHTPPAAEEGGRGDSSLHKACSQQGKVATCSVSGGTMLH